MDPGMSFAWLLHVIKFVIRWVEAIFFRYFICISCRFVIKLLLVLSWSLGSIYIPTLRAFAISTTACSLSRRFFFPIFLVSLQVLLLPIWICCLQILVFFCSYSLALLVSFFCLPSESPPPLDIAQDLLCASGSGSDFSIFCEFIFPSSQHISLDFNLLSLASFNLSSSLLLRITCPMKWSWLQMPCTRSRVRAQQKLIHAKQFESNDICLLIMETTLACGETKTTYPFSTNTSSQFISIYTYADDVWALVRCVSG